nr:reverse transcriptase domain-containing protein [Tanacetum cinerariifolium]
MTMPHELLMIEALQRDVSTLQGQQIDDGDRLTRHIRHENAQRDAAPEDGDRANPNLTTAAIEPMTQEAINNLIAQRVTEALTEYKIYRNSVVKGDTSHTTGTGPRTCFNLGNSYMRLVSQEVSYAMPWKTLRQMMTMKYYPRGEIKKLEVKLWNLKVKGTDITSYTLRFQKLALLYGRMFLEESDEIERYKAIEFANDQMDQKLLRIADRQADTKGSLTILQGTNKTNNHLEGTTMLHGPMLQGLKKRNHTEEPNLYALNATSTMMDHVVPNAPTARGLAI